jgi:hypothetical protein
VKVRIVDLAYPANKPDLGVSAQWVTWKCRTLGIDIVGGTDAADLVLASSTSPVDAPKIPRRLSGVPFVVGGSGALEPAAYLRYGATAAVLGDGGRFLEVFARDGLDVAMGLPNVMCEEHNNPTVDGSFDFNCPIFTSEDGVRRIILGRGCRHKCLFCQTSWALPYVEHDNPRAAIRAAQKIVEEKRRIGYITNDLAMHVWAKSLPKSSDANFSFDYLRKMGLPKQIQVRLGVEGVSERLRRFVAKPISHDDLIKCTVWLSDNGKSPRWFLIAGLPTETDSDWDELREAVQEWKRLTKKGSLMLSFTAWCPSPATPLATMPLHDDYQAQIEAFREWFFAGRGWSSRIFVKFPRLPTNRLKSAMLVMDATEAQLRAGGARGGNSGVIYPHAASCAAIRARL